LLPICTWFSYAVFFCQFLLKLAVLFIEREERAYLTSPTTIRCGSRQELDDYKQTLVYPNSLFNNFFRSDFFYISKDGKIITTGTWLLSQTSEAARDRPATKKTMWKVFGILDNWKAKFFKLQNCNFWTVQTRLILLMVVKSVEITLKNLGGKKNFFSPVSKLF